MASLAEIRARIAAQDNKSVTKGSNTQSDNSIYAHWNMDEGTTVSIRYLPDADPKNEFFWVEKQMIKLAFNGIKGESNSKPTTISVPCIEMYGDNCPILAEVRPWYKDETLKEMANKYWKKRTYLFQGFVRQNPMGDDKTPANPIRRFVISPQIIPIIKAGLMDPEIMELPTDYMRGLDFNIKKTSKGGYADYSTSNWSRRESPLTQAEQDAIEAHGLFNLKDFLPKKPGEAEMRVIVEMFEASVAGNPFDNERWGQYYRPWGVEAPSGTKADSDEVSTSVRTSAPQAVSRPVVAQAAPWEADAQEAAESIKIPQAATSSDKAQDILALIRARQTKTS